jgi:hypothetical protein
MRGARARYRLLGACLASSSSRTMVVVCDSVDQLFVCLFALEGRGLRLSRLFAVGPWCRRSRKRRKKRVERSRTDTLPPARRIPSAHHGRARQSRLAHAPAELAARQAEARAGHPGDERAGPKRVPRKFDTERPSFRADEADVRVRGFREERARRAERRPRGLSSRGARRARGGARRPAWHGGRTRPSR